MPESLPRLAPAGATYGSEGGDTVPTRRVLELAVITAIAMRPVFGMVRLWSRKTLDSTNPGSVSHGTAEILTVVT